MDNYNYQQTNQGTTEQVSFGSIHHNLADLTPTSSEVGHLWTAYLAESMSVCFLTKWSKEAQDPEINQYLREVLTTSNERVQIMENLFKTINYPIPLGFDEKDLNLNAPPLFSQAFTCLYTRMMQKMILHHYMCAATSSYRSDFLDFYSDCLKKSEALHRKATEILLAKGILQKHPSIVQPTSLETVSNKSYFGSYFHIFGDKRTLNAIEISIIYTMMEIKQLVKTLQMGFSQTVKSKKVKEYLLKSIEIGSKQFDILARFLTEQEVARPSLSQILITNSQESAFSDRLILTHTSAATAYIATAYGLGMPDLYRKDLTAALMRFISEVLGLAKDGAELMVKEGWLEKIPETANRKQLSH
ncbi:MAG TPA: DUF3231 family protein [Peptococcaceae bacterium]|nr:DUF3231 family protein [Peptococcaceae bacterium]